ncbi:MULTISPECIES: MSMEG_0572/Sll0783 family nitrogen starvation response protein [Antrihabitans]|uniref:MSMEG_0572/Sll0783 family nitrogen starvation response protein n=1 Tax=Antrihabitans spumae TaxID=3373370 RepID=A0ABW7KRV3_9NOCA
MSAPTTTTTTPTALAEIEQAIEANITKSLAEIPHPSLPKGTNIYGSTKIFPDYKAESGESYFTLVHGIAHESSVSFVAVLQATRALRKGFESAIYFYGPGAINAIANRGFPTTGDSGFPGEQNINDALAAFIKEGGKVFACRFGLALHGAREEDLIEGVIPAHPLDVQDALIHYARKGAIINSTYQV